jgi:hypothetical protein
MTNNTEHVQQEMESMGWEWEDKEAKRKEIAEQISEFLESGGEIQQIARGRCTLDTQEQHGRGQRQYLFGSSE